jgi:hypothetical protein
MSEEINFGPLTKLLGVWKGDKGVDKSPEQYGLEENPYFETIEFSPVGNVTNAETQDLASVRYHQVVTKKKNNEVFHDELGYWMWDEKNKTIMHSLTIPRGVCVLAGGIIANNWENCEELEIKVEASLDHEKWGIIQSPFMAEKAKTTAFTHSIKIRNDKLIYNEITFLDIYGKSYEHSDQNELQLQ